MGPNDARLKVTDKQILNVLTQYPEILATDGAALLKITPRAFSERAKKLGHSFGAFREKRRVIFKYLLDLGAWIKAQHSTPSVQQIETRHIAECESGAESAREFTKYFRHLVGKLTGHPGLIDQIKKESKNAKGIMQLGALILRSIRTDSPPAAKKPRKHGRPKIPNARTEWYKNGMEVQRLIDGGMKQSEARHKVAASTHREYASIEQYHKRYRSLIAKSPE